MPWTEGTVNPTQRPMKSTPSPSTKISVEALGPSGVKGQVHMLATRKNEQQHGRDRIHDSSELPFKVLITFGLSCHAPVN
jgi:hypothetical protein